MKKIVMQLMKAKKVCGSFNFSAFSRLHCFPKEHRKNKDTSAREDKHLAAVDDPEVDSQTQNEASNPDHSVAATLMTTVIFLRAHLFMICEYTSMFQITMPPY